LSNLFARFYKRVTQRFLYPLKCWLLGFSLLCTAFAPLSVRAAEGIDIVQAHLESTEEGYKLSATFAFDLNHGLEDVIVRGVPLYFTTEIDITRSRWYWFNEHSASASQTIRISYNVLTREFHAGVPGRLQQSFPTLDDALSMVRRPARWVVAERDALKPGQTYQVSVRMRLDLAQLPKTFQVHALNNSDWRLSSDWKNFEYKAE
jgi:hypothetical protein